MFTGVIIGKVRAFGGCASCDCVGIRTVLERHRREVAVEGNRGGFGDGRGDELFLFGAREYFVVFCCYDRSKRKERQPGERESTYLRPKRSDM